jgi:DNA-binding response OmpR family regulator
MAEKKILIVDFDKRSLDSLAELLEPHNFKMIRAMDGAEAYEKFKAEDPDLVILEAMLPKLHGFDLTHRIFKETKGKVPVIIITSVYKGLQYRGEAIRNLGATEYFEKPYDKEKLLEFVLKLIKGDEEKEEEVSEIQGIPSEETVIKNLARRIKKRASS